MKKVTFLPVENNVPSLLSILPIFQKPPPNKSFVYAISVVAGDYLLTELPSYLILVKPKTFFILASKPHFSELSWCCLYVRLTVTY